MRPSSIIILTAWVASGIAVIGYTVKAFKETVEGSGADVNTIGGQAANADATFSGNVASSVLDPLQGSGVGGLVGPQVAADPRAVNAFGVQFGNQLTSGRRIPANPRRGLRGR